MIRIKICGMRDRGSIREISALRPDYMGFIFYPHSKRYFGNDMSAIRRLPDFIKRVGVFVNERLDTILKTASRGKLDLIQLHGSEKPELCDKIRSKGYSVIKAFSIDKGFEFSTLAPYRDVCDLFLFDSKSEGFGGSGLKFKWEQLHDYTYDVPYFLSGGIEASDHQAIMQIKDPLLYAVDINSRFETQPGVKDLHLVEKFMNGIRKNNINQNQNK